jgi:4-hydroxy-tetrahydrodipicolinate reductase
MKQPSQTLKIALIGYGKMGKAIERIAQARGHEIVLRVDSKNAATELERLSEADIAIEFTQPKQAAEHLKACLLAGIPVVCGTTGWKAQQAEIQALCQEKNGAMIVSPNFSIGVNLFFKLNRYLAHLMDPLGKLYSAQIEETHHKQKLDAPSGTATQLGWDLIDLHRSYQAWQLQQPDDPQYNGQLPIYAFREDEVPGTHRVIYQSEEDRIEIQHTAFSRDGFAFGAVIAAEWLWNKNGLFTMDDVLAGKFIF